MHQIISRKKMKKFSCILLVLILNINLFSCTTALISGKATIDGSPLLIKHRDSDYMQNRMVFFKDARYRFIGLVNSPDEKNLEVWGGCNSEGFAIINSASYNLKAKDDNTEEADREGILMKIALGNCATVAEFEMLLNDLPKPLGVEANFGVIDALGNGAYFETNNFSYTKFDVNDTKVAPHGYLIRTNYSFSGRKDEGYGYIRYMSAEEMISLGTASNRIDVKYVFNNLSRNLRHALTGEDLTNNLNAANEMKFNFFEDFIPRFSSSSSIMIRGVRKGESPDFSTIWTILGFPLTSVAIPTFVCGGENLPNVLVGDNTGNAPLCNFSLVLKNDCFPIKRGSGKRYINVSAILNTDNTGILQKLKPLEQSIYNKTDIYLKKWHDSGSVKSMDIKELYDWIDNSILSSYKNLFNVN